MSVTNQNPEVVEVGQPAVASKELLERGCKCIDAIREQLKAHHKSDVELELKMFMNMQTMTTHMGLPPLRYTYMEGKKRKKSHVTFNYCPFCGKEAL